MISKKNCFVTISFLLLTIINGCKPAEVNPPDLPAGEDVILNNIAFGNDSLQKLDAYLPKNRNSNTPVIIYIHGGGWFQGDKSEIRDGAIYFQQQGVPFISINYRLTRTSQNHIHPAQIQDIQNAINFIISKSGAWNISATKLAFWGGSAGSQLSLLYAYKYNNDKKIKAVVSTAGPTDLTDPVLNQNSIGGLSVGDMILSYIGQPLSAAQQQWRDASPVNYIGTSTVPSMFIHGTVDSAVPYQQSLIAYQKLQLAGVQSFIEPLPNIGHGLEGADWGYLIPKIIAFVNTYAQ